MILFSLHKYDFSKSPCVYTEIKIYSSINLQWNNSGIKNTKSNFFETVDMFQVLRDSIIVNLHAVKEPDSRKQRRPRIWVSHRFDHIITSDFNQKVWNWARALQLSVHYFRLFCIFHRTLRYTSLRKRVPVCQIFKTTPPFLVASFNTN